MSAHYPQFAAPEDKGGKMVMWLAKRSIITHGRFCH
jgi:hypothetical protein